MKEFCIFLSLLAACLLFNSAATATTVEARIDLVAAEVATLKLGFDHYVLGSKLTDAQKEKARQNPIQKSLKGTYKFRDGEIFVVAIQENDIVLGLYKDYPETTMDKVKEMVGSLMFAYGEPTVSAHDKLIYWNYNEKGKITRDVFEIEKASGAESLATIKFSSSKVIGSESSKEDPEPISVYLMITSDPLSRLYLASIEGQ